MSVDASKLPFIRARWYGEFNRTYIAVICIHTMEAPQTKTAALDCAHYFEHVTRKASAHYCVDEAAIFHCVQEKDIAYAAPGCNQTGVHIEHAGYASMDPAGWGTPYSDAMLKLSAGLAADIVHRHDIPLVWLTPADLIAGKRGFTSHAGVSAAFHLSTHTDPGTAFPHATYLADVKAALNG